MATVAGVGAVSGAVAGALTVAGAVRALTVAGAVGVVAVAGAVAGLTAVATVAGAVAGLTSVATVAGAVAGLAVAGAVRVLTVAGATSDDTVAGAVAGALTVAGAVAVAVASAVAAVRAVALGLLVSVGTSTDTAVGIDEAVAVSVSVTGAAIAVAGIADVLSAVLAEERTSSRAADTVGGTVLDLTAVVGADETSVGVVLVVVVTDLVIPDALVTALIVVIGLAVVMVVVVGLTVVVIEGGVVDGVGGAVRVTIEIAELGAGTCDSARVADVIALNGMVTEVIVISSRLGNANLTVDSFADATNVEEVVLVAVGTSGAEAERAGTLLVAELVVVVAELVVVVAELVVVVAVLAIEGVVGLAVAVTTVLGVTEAEADASLAVAVAGVAVATVAVAGVVAVSGGDFTVTRAVRPGFGIPGSNNSGEGTKGEGCVHFDQKDFVFCFNSDNLRFHYKRDSNQLSIVSILTDNVR